MLSTKSFIRCLFILAITVIAWRVYNHDVRAQQAPAGVDFARDIAPILRQNCLGCHGPQKQMAGLRLDDKKTALAKVIIPGKAADSELYRRVAGLSDQARMPMKGQPLGASQISAIKRWIDEGAAWPDGETGGQGDGEKRKHWAFVAPVRPALPVVADKAWVRNPVDAFVLARLEKENLKPAPAADKITLLRRLSFDLTGLPPTPEEVDAFLADKSSRAYEKQVDRLLASPHYGERQARHWLDAARYADSDGFEKDKSRFVWFYRDWVINAFNQDKPYNQFIIEQIAGDLLPNATQDQRVATGFLRNSMNNEEGGIDPEQFRMEAMFDRMDAIGKSVLGLTIQCAQCHNHKFDPLKQEEYYRLFAFLNNSHESNLAVYTPEEQMKRAEILRRTQEIEAGLKHKTPDWPSRMQQWEQDIQRNHPEWTPEWKVIQPIVEDISTGGMRIIPQPDGSFVAGGYSPVKARPKFILKTEARNITAFRLELLTDPNLPRNGPGRSNSGSCALTEFELQTAPVSAPDKVTKHKFASATADISPPEKELDKMFDDKGKAKRVTGPVEFAIDGKEETAWTIDNGPGRRNASRKAVFNLATPAGEEGGTILTIHLRQHHGGWNNNDHQQQNIGRFRLSMTTAPNATADPLPAAVREILPIPHAQRTPAQTQTVFQYWRTTVPEFTADNQQIDSLWNQHPAGALQLVLNERSEMRDTHLLKRGDFLRPDKTVTANVPAFLHALPANAPGNRLTFAQWLTDRNSPTTARTFVNRVWQQYFGTGIVATSEDFGLQSDAPSHPELLDLLAVEFMEGRGEREKGRKGEREKWSIKALHKQIVMSATYRQSSKVAPETINNDPYNRLLARGPRMRVDAEIVRDIALGASGLLNPAIGGPSVYPPAPAFLFLPPVSYGTKPWREETGANRYRRGLYTFRYRSVPFPVFQAFDAPPADVSCVRRSRSNTPMQALTLLNEPLFLESARALALKTLREGGATDEARLTFAFRRVLSRKPSLEEMNVLRDFLRQQTARIAAGELKTNDLLDAATDKPLALPPGVSPQAYAAWTTVARALLNLDEAITKE